MKICPNCNSSGTGSFCAQCGTPLVYKCESCGALVETTHNFCSRCGTPLAMAEKPDYHHQSPGSVGDIGMVKGNVDFSTHIGHQINVSSGASLNIGAGKPDPPVEALITKARAALESGDYALARQLTTRIMELYPHNIEGRYLHALTLLKGRRPKVLALDEVRAIERILLSLIASDQQSHYYYFLALLRDDFYRSNSMRMPSPDPTELLRQAETAHLDRSEAEFVLAHVPVPQSPLVLYIFRRCQ